MGSNPTRASSFVTYVSGRSFKSIDYNFLVFVRITNLGKFGNNRKKSLLQTLNCTPVCVWNRMRVEVQRGFDSSVSQLLLRDLSGHADIVKH